MLLGIINQSYFVLILISTQIFTVHCVISIHVQLVGTIGIRIIYYLRTFTDVALSKRSDNSNYHTIEFQSFLLRLFRIKNTTGECIRVPTIYLNIIVCSRLLRSPAFTRLLKTCNGRRRCLVILFLNYTLVFAVRSTVHILHILFYFSYNNRYILI